MSADFEACRSPPPPQPLSFLERDSQLLLSQRTFRVNVGGAERGGGVMGRIDVLLPGGILGNVRPCTFYTARIDRLFGRRDKRDKRQQRKALRKMRKIVEKSAPVWKDELTR